MREMPSDCALLITAPITKEDFLSDVENDNKDFLRNWANNQRAFQKFESGENLTTQRLWEIYSINIKDFILNISEELKSFGVDIIFNAKLEDLPQIFSNYKIVTIEAHWFSPKIEINDFYDFDSFIKQLSESNELVVKAFRNSLFSNESNLVSSIQSNEDCKTNLVKNINRLFSNFNSTENKPKSFLLETDTTHSHEEFWIHLNRFALEKSFPGKIRQRCKIEMFDGLHFVTDFESNVPVDFDGVIDLTVCNSEHVGKEIKQSRKCQVITNRFPTDLKIRLILYKGIIKSLHNGVYQNYVEATFRLRKQLLEQTEWLENEKC